LEFGWVSAIDSNGRTIWIADGHGEGKHLGAHKEEKLTAFRNSNLRFALAERLGDCRVREVTLDKVSRIT